MRVSSANVDVFLYSEYYNRVDDMPMLLKSWDTGWDTEKSLIR
jgi:hypothetical protein